MTDVREATDDLLAEKPQVESGLREVLAVDERTDGWTFDEIPLDSGTFGELVSRNIVAKNGDSDYEVADPSAVQASLDGEPTVEDDGDAPTLPSVPLPSLSREAAAALGGALAVVALMRTYIFSSVFRGEYVVLPSNDPYYYRYWVEQLAANATGIFDFSVLSGLPGAVSKGEPLMVATLWWVTNLLGGPDAAGFVLAWFPVVSGLIVAGFVYVLGTELADDRRVGVAAVLVLATIPGFAYRTGLGFADHHAFDYPWLVLTALSLVWLADVTGRDLRRPRTWLAAGALAIGVAGQVMAWEAGPLLIGAVGFYVAIRALADVEAGRSPLIGSAPIVAGLAVAAALSHLAHTGFGWHTGVVAYSPALLLVGVLGVSALAEAIHRVEMPAYVLGAAEAASVLGGVVVLQTLLPSYGDKLNQEVSRLVAGSTGAAEAQSLMGGALGFLLGPPLELGLAWFLALPVLVWGLWYGYRNRHEPWLVVTTYGAYFLILSVFQRRFSGELSPFLAVLAGVGFVWFAAKMDIVQPLAFLQNDAGGRPTEEPIRVSFPSLGAIDRRTVAPLLVIFLLISSVGIVQTAVKHEQVKIEGDQHQAAAWMDEYADDRAWEYPDNYVFSKWGRNRMYNYFVNGESRGYGYAQSNYEPFLSSTNPGQQYREHDDNLGFVVTRDLDLPGRVPEKSMYARLQNNFGSATEETNGVGHYRAMFASADGSVKVFTLVPGANVTGTAAPNETLRLSKNVNIEGASFTYSRTVQAGEDGTFSATVPYPGEYEVGNRSVAIPESAVRNGGNVSVGA